jgi:hypothetical protein
MKEFIDFLALIFVAVVIAVFFQCTPIKDAYGADLMQLRKAAIEGGSYQGTSHDFLLLMDNDAERVQHTTNMIMNVDLSCTQGNDVCLFWDNTIASKATTSQYRSVMWNFRTGFALGNMLDIGWEHRSRHMLDGKGNDFARFELENVIFLQLKFYDKPRIYK